MERIGIVVAAVGMTVFAGGAWAQCFDWEGGFETAGASAEVRAHVVFDDGSGPALYVGGAFRTIGNIRANGVAKWDGASWSPLGAGIDGNAAIVHTLCLHDDGSGPALFVGGAFTAAGSAPANNIAKWNGSSWAALGAGITDLTNAAEVRCLAAYDSGSGAELFVGGDFYFAGGSVARSLARWDGANWSVPGYSGVGFAGVGGVVHAFSVYDSGTGSMLYAGGSYGLLNGMPGNNLAAWNGATWTSISGITDQVRALAVHDDGGGDELYVGAWSNLRVRKWDGATLTTIATTEVGIQAVAFGSFDDGVNGERLYLGTLGGERVYAWDGVSWTAPLAEQLDNGVRTLGAFDIGAGEQLFVGGEFRLADSTRVDYLGWSDGATITPVHAPSSVDAPVRALASFDTGSGAELIAGGAFVYAGAGVALGLANFDGASWSDCGATLGGLGTGDARAFTKWDDGAGEALFLGGGFMTIDGQPFNHVARWDGAQFTPLDEGLSPTLISKVNALAVFDLGAGERLFAGGDFGSMGSGSGNGQAVARWTGTTWTSILGGSLFGVEVRALAGFNSPSGPRLVQGSGYVFGGGSGYRVSQWNGSSWSALGSDANGDVNALAPWNDGSGEKLYAAGAFSTVGGVSAARIACWDGSQWTALGSGINGTVYALELFDDGGGFALYAGGEFTSAGGVAASNVARWNGSTWSALGSGVDGRVNAFAVHDDGSEPALFLGGEMRAAGNVVANFTAKWSRSCVCGPVSYCTSGTTSNGCVPTISSVGQPSASAASGFTISIASVEGQKQGHIFYGLTGPNAASWGASSHFLCVKAPSQRTGTQDSNGTAGACDGVIALDWNAYVATHPMSLGVPFSAGTNVWAQLYFRDPAGPKTTALSNGLMFTVCP